MPICWTLIWRIVYINEYYQNFGKCFHPKRIYPQILVLVLIFLKVNFEEVNMLPSLDLMLIFCFLLLELNNEWKIVQVMHMYLSSDVHVCTCFILIKIITHISNTIQIIDISTSYTFLHTLYSIILYLNLNIQLKSELHTCMLWFDFRCIILTVHIHFYTDFKHNKFYDLDLLNLSIIMGYLVSWLYRLLYYRQLHVSLQPIV